jgi:protein TonB
VLTTLTTTPAQAPDGREWGARSLSLVVHTVLIALAVWYTQASRVLDGARPDPGVFLMWSRHPASAHAPPPRAPAAPAPTGLPVATLVPVPGLELPPIDLPPAAGWPVAPADPGPGFPGATLPASPVGPPSPPQAPPMDARMVEEPPILLHYPAPGYPELLRRAGVEGRVLMEAVLDTTGRAERASLRIVSSTHALFVPEATALVLGSRYRPARFGGKAVRVRIQVPVSFALRR